MKLSENFSGMVEIVGQLSVLIGNIQNYVVNTLQSGESGPFPVDVKFKLLTADDVSTNNPNKMVIPRVTTPRLLKPLGSVIFTLIQLHWNFLHSAKLCFRCLLLRKNIFVTFYFSPNISLLSSRLTQLLSKKSFWTLFFLIIWSDPFNVSSATEA